MAININSLINELKRSGVSDGIIQQLLGAAGESLSSIGGVDRDSSVTEIQRRVSEITSLLDNNRGLLDGVVDVEEEKAKIEDEEMDLLREVIDSELESTQANQDRVRAARDRYKQLVKNKKQREAMNVGMAKGSAAAENLLARTLGINKEFAFLNKKGGMGGLLKGFTQGIMKSLGPMNIIVSIITKMIERIGAFDSAKADMFRKAAIGRGRFDLNKAVVELKGMKTGLEKDVVNSVTTLKTNFRGFVDLTGEQLVEIGKTMSVMSAMGVSNSESADMFGNLTKTLGYAEPEARRIMTNFTATAEALGRPPQEMVSDFNKAQPILARFGKKSEKIFKDAATQATLLNMDVSKVISLGESMDTFEGAAKAAQAFNVAIGQPFLSAQALLAAESPADKLQLVADAYKRAGRPELGARMIRGLAGDIGVDSAELIRVLKLQKGKYQLRKEKADKATTSLNQALNLVFANQSMFDKINAQMERIIDNLIVATGAEKGVMFLVDNLTKIIKNVMDTIDKYGLYGRSQDATRMEDVKKIEKRKASGRKSQLSGEGGNFFTKAFQDMAGGSGTTSFGRIDDSANQLKNLHSSIIDNMINPYIDPKTGVFNAQKAMGNHFSKRSSDTIKRAAPLKQHYDIGDMMLRGLLGGNSGFPGSGPGNLFDSAALEKYRDQRLKSRSYLNMEEDPFTEMFFDVYLPAIRQHGSLDPQTPMKMSTLDAELSKFKSQFSTARTEDGYVQPVFNKNDKFYAAKDGGAITKALDEVLGAVDKLIAQKQDVNLNISERKLVQAVDGAFIAMNARRV